MKHFSILLIFLFLGGRAWGQHDIGVKINGGISKIRSTESGVFRKENYMPSGHIGGFYTFHLNKINTFGGELLFSQIIGKEELHYETPSSFVERNFLKRISYLGIPVYYGLKWNKFTLYAGFQASFLIASGGKAKFKAIESSSGEIEEFHDSLRKGIIDFYDFGPIGGFSVSFGKKYAIEGRYYYGLNNIIKEKKLPGFAWRIEQASIGFKYTIKQLGKKIEE